MAPPGFTPRPTEDHLGSLSIALIEHEQHRDIVRYLKPNEPYFHLCDTVWATLHRLDYREAEYLLRNRAAKGFTSVMIVLFVQHGFFQYPNRQGDWMFEDAGKSPEELNGNFFDGQGKWYPKLDRPNPKYWAHVDRVVKLASSLGIGINFLPTWGRYVTGGYYGGPILFDEKNAFEYGQFLGERYPFHPWILGGDTNRYWSPKVDAHVKACKDPKEIEIIDFGPVFESIARGLQAGEKLALENMDNKVASLAKGYRPFITFHSGQPWLPHAPEALNCTQWPDADWLTLDCCQTGHQDGHMEAGGDGFYNAQAGGNGIPMWQARNPYIPVRKMYNAKVQPVIDLEPHYEHMHEWFDWRYPDWKAPDIRNGSLQSVFAGSCGIVYGCNSLIQMHNDQSKTHVPIIRKTVAYTNWYLELDLPGSFNVGTIRRIFLSLPHFFDRVPDQSFLLSETNEPKDGTPAGDKLISGLRSKTWAMVHLPYGGTVTISLDRALPQGGKWRSWWIDPATGGRTAFDKGEKAEGPYSFKSPSEGTLDEDWLLFVETESRIWPEFPFVE